MGDQKALRVWVTNSSTKTNRLFLAFALILQCIAMDVCDGDDTALG